jgi:hypothetical protein
MRTILAAVLLSILGTATALSEESPKLKVATIRLDRFVNSGMNYEMNQLFSMDKETLKLYKKVQAEIQKAQKDLADIDDEIKLAEMGRKIEFLNRKLGMIQQQGMNHRRQRDIQSCFRDFVIEQYKDKYRLILQDTGLPERCLCKGNAEFSDITDEAIGKFKDYLNRLGDEEDSKTENKSEDEASKTKAKEFPKIVVATVQVDRITNSGVNYEKLRIFSADKTTIEVLKKISDEIQAVQKEIASAENEGKLDELGKKLNFLTTKYNLLQPRISVNPVTDIYTVVRKFVVGNFQDKYPLILRLDMQESRMMDRILWKDNVEFVDITDEVADKFKEYLDRIPTNQGRMPPIRSKNRHSSVPLIKEIPAAPEDDVLR